MAEKFRAVRRKFVPLCIIAACVFPMSICSRAFSQGPAETPAKRLEVDAKTGLELWETMLGRLWIPGPGLYVIKHLQWEQMVQKVYHHPMVHVRQGDVVLDCGAHIGGFTRVALLDGARLVVAIEPERANLAAFRRNFQRELQTGQVRLVEKGVWDTAGKIALHLSSVGDSHSAVIPQDQGKDETIDVISLDALVETLKLPRVDFIKMDIEGAELKALRGARKVLARDHPRLAISSYHQKGDPAAICTIVWQTCPDYLVASKDISDGPHVPKVLFFYR
jgi:FkbM family methyltransferase